MLYTQLIYGTMIITAVVIFHVASLVFLARLLKRWHDNYSLFDNGQRSHSGAWYISFLHHRYSHD